MTNKISSQNELEECALRFGILPFFRNNIPGFSVEEMTAPGMLFGGNEFDGCWEWKGPVIRKRTTAYGKFFRRKAGFVNLDLLPWFIKMRRDAFPIKEGSPDEMIYEIICINDKITTTELRELIKGKPKKRQAYDLPELSPGTDFNQMAVDSPLPKRGGIEGPLQRLQMGGWICISDFKYKQTRKGERYGWGVAEYSTPELLYNIPRITDISPEECRDKIISYVNARYPQATPDRLAKLLR